MCSCVQDVPMKWFLTSLVIYCNMAIYCNTLEGNMQYGVDPYCFTPRAYAALEDLITGTECHQWELKCMGQTPYPVTRVTTHSLG